MKRIAWMGLPEPGGVRGEAFAARIGLEIDAHTRLARLLNLEVE